MAKSDAIIEELVTANRILANEGIVDSFGHVSVRHPKRADDLRLIATTFEPYLTARAWKTIENPAP